MALKKMVNSPLIVLCIKSGNKVKLRFRCRMMELKLQRFLPLLWSMLQKTCIMTLESGTRRECGHQATLGKIAQYAILSATTKASNVQNGKTFSTVRK